MKQNTIYFALLILYSRSLQKSRFFLDILDEHKIYPFATIYIHFRAEADMS